MPSEDLNLKNSCFLGRRIKLLDEEDIRFV
jgi:hypothetical protein